MTNCFCCFSVTESWPLWSHGLRHSRVSCPSLSPEVCLNSCPLNQWCHPTISSSVIPFITYPQFFPASGSFPKSRLFASGGQSIEDSASAPALPMNIQGWLPLVLTGPLQSKAISFELCSILKHQFFGAQPSLWSKSHIHTWLLGEKQQQQQHSFDYTLLTFIGKIMSLLFNMPFRFIIAFLPRSKCLLISWL